MAPAKPGKGKTAANALVTALAVLGGIIGVNIIASRFSAARWDLTQDKVYGLSQSSRDTVKNLPDRLTVKAFISSGLQPPLNTYGQYIRDLLDEYAAASGGKLQWEVIDPLAPGKDADETRTRRDEYKSKYKIKPITLERMSESKLEIGSDNFLAIAFVYGEQIESIPQVGSTEGLEYRITSLIKKMTAAKRRKIGFASSEGELTPQQGLQWYSQVVQDYDEASVTLDKPIGEDVDVLFIVGPKSPFTEKAKWVIDQFLMKGKPVALFVDGMIIDSPRGMQMPGMEQPKIGRQNDVNLEDLLTKYGLKLHDDLILDRQNAPGPVPVDGQLYLANYPTFVRIDEKGINPKLGLTSHLNGLIIPFASSMELVGDLKDGKAAGVTATPIVSSSAESWRQSGFFVFNPQVKLEPAGDKGPFVLGYALEGKLKSAYPSGPPGTPAGTSPSEPVIAESPGVRLVVFGSSGLFHGENLQPVIQHVPLYLNNLLFFNQAADWLVHDDSLIALRAKGMGQRPLTIPPEGSANLWRYLCEVGLPFLVILLGIGLWALRSARRRSFTL